jgi:SAM-dependent methyltransferase
MTDDADDARVMTLIGMAQRRIKRTASAVQRRLDNARWEMHWQVVDRIEPLIDASFDSATRGRIVDEIRALEPWYQPIHLGPGLTIRSTSKTGTRHAPGSRERGLGKWQSIIVPALPRTLAGARVLDVGSNAGLFLLECARAGAQEAVGIEVEERCVRQAALVHRIASRLDRRAYAIEVHHGNIEALDLSTYGYFDMGLLLSVIYHVGREAERAEQSTPERARARGREVQLEVLARLAERCRYLVFQAYTQHDDGRGDGRESLLEIVTSAGLIVVHEVFDASEDRGCVVIARSPTFTGLRDVPLSRLVGRSGRRLEDAAEYALPENEELPWLCGERSSRGDGARARDAQSVDVLERLVRSRACTLESLELAVHVLVHPVHGELYQIVDDDPLVWALARQLSKEALDEMMLRARLLRVVHRDTLLELPAVRRFVGTDLERNADVLARFDSLFVDERSQGSRGS